MSTFYWSDELYHHGILGMKWGVRRYQNPDGSLTEAGRKRYTYVPADGKRRYNSTDLIIDYNYNRYGAKGKTALNVVKNEFKKSAAYDDVKKKISKRKNREDAEKDVRDVDTFVRKLLDVEYVREHPDNATTRMAREIVNDMWKETKKERKQQMKNDPSEQLNKLTIGDALKSAAIGALAGPYAASAYTAKKLAEDRTEKKKSKR